MKALKGFIVIMLGLSVLLRPLLAEALLLPATHTSTETSEVTLSISAHTTMHKTLHTEHCKTMHGVEKTAPCCDHHNHFSSEPCADCGDQCDCVKHLHIGSFALPEPEQIVLTPTTQKHDSPLASALSLGMPNLPERPPQSL